jgi:hypothetical protein
MSSDSDQLSQPPSQQSPEDQRSKALSQGSKSEAASDSGTQEARTEGRSRRQPGPPIEVAAGEAASRQGDEAASRDFDDLSQEHYYQVVVENDIAEKRPTIGGHSCWA